MKQYIPIICRKSIHTSSACNKISPTYSVRPNRVSGLFRPNRTIKKCRNQNILFLAETGIFGRKTEYSGENGVIWQNLRPNVLIFGQIILPKPNIRQFWPKPNNLPNVLFLQFFRSCISVSAETENALSVVRYLHSPYIGFRGSSWVPRNKFETEMKYLFNPWFNPVRFNGQDNIVYHTRLIVVLSLLGGRRNVCYDGVRVETLFSVSSSFIHCAMNRCCQ